MKAESTDTSFFTSRHEPGFGSYSPADELLHGSGDIDDAALTETQFLGFNVPEAGIHSVNYLWVHPNLHVISGGAWAWQGIKRHTLGAELFDMRQYLPADLLRPGDLADYQLPSGYRVQVIEPLEKVRISYEDSLRDNAFDVTLTAVMPPAMVAGGRHFDQAMRTEGMLRLRGRSHVVNGYTVRDRSWGEARSEAPRPAPPGHFLTGVFGDDFAFHIMGIEDPDTGPVWRDLFPEAKAMTAINRGWVWFDGELSGLETISFGTEWDLDVGRPVRHTIAATDTTGRDFELRGTVIASCPWNTWSNCNVRFALARWECRGRTGFGDSQVASWTDFVHHCLD